MKRNARNGRWLCHAASALLAAVLGTAVCRPADASLSVAVVWLDEEGAAAGAFRAELINVLLDKLSEAQVVATVAAPQNAMVRRAVADRELNPEDVTAQPDPAALTRLGRGIGVDWVVGLEVRKLAAADALVEAEVTVTGLLVNAVTGGHKPLQAEKRAGDTEVLEGLEAREATASRILASAMAHRLCEAVLEGILAGDEKLEARAQDPGDQRPRRSSPALQSVPTGIDDRSMRLERQIAGQGATAELCLQLGDAYLVDGKWELALKEFQRAAALDPTLAEPRVRLGNMAGDRGLWQDAIKELRIALELDPANIAARLAMARAYEQASQPTAALRELQVAAELDPDNGALWVRLGDMHSRLDAPRDAEEAYLSAIQAKNPDPRAYGLLGQLYAQRGRFKDAFTYYVRAAKEKSGGFPRSFSERHYRATMAAADEAIAGAMRASRDALQARHEGKLTREEAYEAFVHFAEKSGDISRFAEALQPPAGLQKQHALRLLAYALVEESDLTILQYIDTNDGSHLKYARQVRDEAVEELEKLLKGNGASR